MARVRPARPADFSAFVRLFPELGVDDPIPSETRFSREMCPSTLVAEADGPAETGDGGPGGPGAPPEIVGYVFFQVLADTLYVRNLVTAPAARRHGVGRALLSGAAAIGRARGCSAWKLNVKPDNVAAIGLYEKLGMRKAHRSLALRLPWRATDGVTPIATRPVEPSDDAALERLGDLDAGLIDAQRRRGGRLAVGCVDGAGQWSGLAVFDPAFPGAYPFFVVRAEDALPLLAALRPHALPGDHLNVVVEHRPDVARAIVDAGAAVRLEIDSMHGQLPGAAPAT
jgi:ribosomal protein S18 acetylase RimI-like enzyme